MCLVAMLAGSPVVAKQQDMMGLGDLSVFAAGSPQSGLAIRTVTVTAKGKPHTYKAEVAQSAKQQSIGMMFRKAMPRDTGMLFPINPAREASFYMRNTYVPLDIIFVGPDRRVRNIAANTVPLSEALVSSQGTVSAVLELKGGEAARIGLQPGDMVSW